MNKKTLDWLSAAVNKSSADGDVLEVGSLNVNGSVRPAFADRSRFPRYVGLDMVPGAEVDRVANANAMPFSDGEFSVVVSSSMIEHDARFWLSIFEMNRVLKSGGWLLLTTCGLHFPRHDHPSDYYRFTADGLKAVLEWAGFVNINSSEIGTLTVAEAHKP